MIERVSVRFARTVENRRSFQIHVELQEEGRGERPLAVWQHDAPEDRELPGAIHARCLVHLPREAVHVVLQHEGREGDADRRVDEHHPEMAVDNPRLLIAEEKRNQVHLEPEVLVSLHPRRRSCRLRDGDVRDGVGQRSLHQPADPAPLAGEPLGQGALERRPALAAPRRARRLGRLSRPCRDAPRGRSGVPAGLGQLLRAAGQGVRGVPQPRQGFVRSTSASTGG